ncbi:MAG: PAS domain S-box protein, partial [Candidatus Omnitrophota bacterium]
MISIIPVVFLLFGYFHVRREFTRVYISERSEQVHLFSVLLDERLKKLRDIGLSLAERPLLVNYIKKGNWEDAMAVLEGVNKAIPEINRIFLADTSSTIKADLDHLANAVGTSRSDMDWFQGVSAAWQPYVSEVFYRKSIPRAFVVNIAIPIRDDMPAADLTKSGGIDLSHLGILVLQLTLNRFADIAATWKNVPGDKFMIVDQHGHLVYSSNDSIHTVGKDISSEPVIAKALSGHQLSEFINDDMTNGGSDFFWSSIIPTSSWRIVLDEPGRIFSQQVNEHMKFINLITFLSLVGYLIFIVLFFRYLMVLCTNQNDLQSIFDASKIGLMLIDDKLTVRRINRSLNNLQHKTLRLDADIRAGELLCCIHAVKNKHRCGEGNHCVNCDINMIICQALHEKTPSHRDEVNKSFMINGKEELRCFMADATPLSINGVNHVLLSLMDITPLKQSQEVIRQARISAEMAMEIQDKLVTSLTKEIEERKLIEKNLKSAQQVAIESEVWWRSLIQEIPAVTFVLEKDGIIRSVNRSWLGIPVDKLTGHSLLEFMDVEQQQVLVNVLADVFDKRMSVHYESRGISLLGDNLWFENHVWPVEVNDRIAGSVLLAFDITDKKHASDLFKEMSLAVEHSPLAIVITDRFGKVKYVNPRFTDVTGYCLEEIYGKISRVFREGEMLSNDRKILWDTLEKGQDWRGEFLERCKDGREFWEQVTITPVIGGNGRIANLIILKENIHEQKQVKQKLMESEKRFMDVLYASNDAILLIYGDKFVDCNEATAQMLKYADRSEFLMAHPSKLSPPQQPDGRNSFEKAQEMMQIANEKGFNRFEWMHRKADGTDFPVEVSLTPIVYDAKPLLYCVWRDISEHKKASDELNRNQTEMVNMLEELKLYNVQLEDAQQKLVQQEKLVAIGFLAAGVAHEINNPLGFVHGNLVSLEEYARALLKMTSFLGPLNEAISAGDLVKAGEINALVEEERKQLEIDYISADIKKLIVETRDGLGRIKKIVQGLKSFSRKDTEGVVSSNINAVVDDAIAIVWNEIKYSAELVKEFEDLPPIACNPQQIGQVLINLLVNAVQAIDGHGVITVKTFRRGGMIVISVADTGAGIPDDIKNKIFDPFFTTKEPGKGTGLGLSISYDIIKKHGGRMDFESKVGVGTTFSIELPQKDCV